MDKLTIFIALVALAILLQAGFLFGMLMALRRLQRVAEEFRGRALPIVEQGRELMVDIAPKLRQIGGNAVDISEVVKLQAHDVAKTLTALNHKARVQIDRADGMINNTMSKAERTADSVQQAVMSPVRKVNGVIAAVVAAVDSYRGVERSSRRSYGSEERFI